jgi:hypothetical protein
MKVKSDILMQNILQFRKKNQQGGPPPVDFFGGNRNTAKTRPRTSQAHWTHPFLTPFQLSSLRYAAKLSAVRQQGRLAVVV